MQSKARAQREKGWRINVPDILARVERHPIDHSSVPQNELDLANRERTSLFPWRGQFSPGLVEVLLKNYSKPRDTVLDPFVGSGTTLFEAARKSLGCQGTEINPAAFEMSRTVHFVNRERSEREKLLSEAKAIIDAHSSSFLFDEDGYAEVLRESRSDPLVYTVVINTLFRYVRLRSKELRSKRLAKSYGQIAEIIRDLPYSSERCQVYLRDARYLPMRDESVDLIITSPPYINVFNYHQNFRRLMEKAGWDLLEVAKSEIGSNRKNRGNRFLTVIQYSLDMIQALYEMRRVLRPDGRVIIVIGRESRVRGIRFENYKILSSIAVGSGCLKLKLRQERKFTSRFGKTIFEDLLHFLPAKGSLEDSQAFARGVSARLLEEGLSAGAEGDVRSDIELALGEAASVRPSPLFEPEFEEG